MQNRAKVLIEKLDLKPHPEGGFFKETYRSDDSIKAEHLVPKFKGDRNYSTAIYFLLTSADFSAFHRIHQDEVWHFYEGQSLIIHEILPDGRYVSTKLGPIIDKGEVFQHVVHGGNYFAVEVDAAEGHSLAGCTVAPGFNFKDFNMPNRSKLLSLFPQHEELIRRLTKA